MKKTTITRDEKSIKFDPEKCNKLFQELVEVYQKHKPTVGEIIISLGNLTYTLGASIGGFKDKGPPVEELEKIYYENPTIDKALMLSGIQTVSWFSSWEKKQLENNKEEGEKQNVSN